MCSRLPGRTLPRMWGQDEPWGATTERNRFVTDGILALGVTALLLLNFVITIPLLSVNGTSDRGLAAVDPLAVELVLVGTLCLIWRRRAPLVVLAISSVAFCSYVALGYPAARPLAPVVALYTLAVTSSSLVASSASVVVIVGVVASMATGQGWMRDDFDDQLVANLLLLGAGCMLGYGIQLSRARTSVLNAQATRLAREHAAETREAIRQEHSRIARELHDVVAHHVSVITAQAGGAQRVFDAEPEEARQALSSIEATGREALIEMRRLLGVLQTEDGEAERTPQPGLDQLAALIAQTERAGLPVQLGVRGHPRPLPSGVELSAYRIVQEALTNTLKHAGPSRAYVELSYHGERLDLHIYDDGRGFTVDSTPGHGLIGMHQRAALLGGELVVGHASDGGVEVSATLPTGAPPR